MTIDLDELQAVVRQTWSAGSARITYDLAWTWSVPKFPSPPRAPVRRALVAVAKGAGKSVGRAVYRAATRGKDPLGHMNAEGVVDLAARRSMSGTGNYAVVQMGGEQWSGRSGRPLATLPSVPATTTSPLWLLDLLRGIVNANGQGQDTIDGDPCRYVRAVVDLTVASAATGGLPSPGRARFDDLLALPIEVWVNATHVRRVRFSDGDASVATRTLTLTLSEFGIEVGQLDWSRLPTFGRSPD